MGLARYHIIKVMKRVVSHKKIKISHVALYRHGSYIIHLQLSKAKL